MATDALHMKVFISWSGDRSRAVADTLRVWLKDVIQAVDPWISGSNIEKGTRGGLEITKELEESLVGIFALLGKTCLHLGCCLRQKQSRSTVKLVMSVPT